MTTHRTACERARAVTVVAVLHVLAACSGESTGVVKEVDPGPGSHFSVLPIPLEKIGRITALGFNNFTLPNAHTYWETCETWSVMRLNRPCSNAKLDLLAPVNGEVVSLDTNADGFLTVQGPVGVVWTFGHVTPAPGLTRGSRVTAGQVVARMFYFHGFDFGVTNFGIRHRHIVPERFSQQFNHGQNPIALYPDALRTELLTRMNAAGPAYGRLAYDSLGTTSGTWVAEGNLRKYIINVDEPLLLWFGRWTERPATQIMSTGLQWPGMENLTLVADLTAPRWEDITPRSGKVAIRLWNMNESATANFSRPGGTVLVEMLGERLSRMEHFNMHAPIADFTTAARRYER